MASDERKAKKREARRAIERVAEVLRRWDPIGVQPGVAGPADEYDGYAPLLVDLVQRGATVEELRAKLIELGAAMQGEAVDTAARPVDVEHAAAFAREIVDALSATEPTVASSQRRALTPDRDEGSYTCPSCGESIVVPLDPSEGDEQSYVEDCPVCCNPNMIHVEFFGEDEPARVWSDAE